MRIARDDPLAVRTMCEYGEEIAFSDPFTPDAERAAAGRETVADRFAALLPANRERAAAQYADGGLPDGQEAVRVWRHRDPASLAARLGDERLAAWAEDDVLHVLWRGEASLVMLTGGVQSALWPVAGAPGLWEASVRVRRLDEAAISVRVSAAAADEPLFGRPGPGEAGITWRGPNAPPPLPDRPLEGQVEEHVLPTGLLDAPRGVSVYLPPGAGSGGPLPGCVLADGQSAGSFAAALEAAILAGTTPPVILVGVHNALIYDPDRPGRPRADLRALEYLPGQRSRRFGAHLEFVAGEVIPWAAGRFPVSPGPWMAGGYSNGAVWAIAAGQRRPGVFRGVAALSAGVPPQRIAPGSRQVRHYLAAGTLETPFRTATSGWAARLERAGMAFRHREWPGGHDEFWWQRELPAALAWLLDGPAS